MKKIFTLTLIACTMFTFYSAKTQTVIFSSDMESWTANVPNNWVGAKTTLEADSISPYTISAHSPTQAVKLVNAESSHKRFSTQPVSVTLNTKFYVSFWVRGHGNIRLGMFDGRSGNGYATYHTYLNINSTVWTHYSDTITCKNSNTAGEFIFSVQSTVADLDHLQLDDVSITDGPVSTNPLISISYPVENALYYSASLDVDFNVMNFIIGNPGAGIDGHIHYTVDGGTVVMHYSTNPISLTGLTTGSHTVITQLVDNSHNPLVPNVADTVHFNIDLNLPNLLTIHDIQYTTDITGNSPWLDSLVSTTGIVTAVAPAGYFVQDGTGTWNGIYIYDNAHHPAQGDNITLTGTVAEYYEFTEFNNILGFTINSSGNALPAVTDVTASTEKTEQFESVLVKITDASCTILPNTYGEWQVYDGDTCNIDDLMYHYVPAMATRYDITGVVYYSFSTFFLEPRGIDDVQVHAGINETEQSSISIYPNPVSEFLTISNANGIEMIRITNLAGQTVAKLDVNSNKVIMDVKMLPEGIYFLMIYNQKGFAGMQKFSKE